MLVAVIVPAYKAEKTIKKVLLTLPEWIDHIVVVDDCSPDHTADIVQDMVDARIHLIKHNVNQGVGGAMLTGYNKALELGADIMVKMDSDGQMDPLYLSDLIAPVQDGKADYTKGNRFIHVRDLGKMPWIRRIGNMGLSFLTKLASGYWNIFDPTNGYTAIHVTIFNRLDYEKIDRRYFFESSMLIELGLLQAVVKDVFIPAVYKGEISSLSILDSFFKFPWKLLKGFLHRIKIQYFIRDFNAVSLFLIIGVPLIFFGFAFGIVNWVHSAHYRVPTTTGTVMIAILPLILGVQLVIQAITLDIQNLPSSPLQKE